ncbi:type IV secretion system protein [Pelomicrobium methylotrophicum]|uniref:Type IV secretion system protein n=1 Tax=Pelomicrobium methylotrophicum TaxID=2602750 RepID=A0A5C7EX20_9PROT|nr:type IV secretion system protein [Pelomicrobium methylotrophicum]TXF11595.1 type IV secretion system protein [Pelomicrobium methylotrophicum]
MLAPKKQNLDAADAPPPYEPGGFERSRRIWFERWGAVEVERNRWFAAFLAAMAGCVALGVAIAAMMPLKTVVPYVIRVDDVGRVQADPAGAQRYSPGEREIKYFLAEWARKLYTLDRALTERWLREAYAFTADRATNQFAEWVEREKPIAAVSGANPPTRTVSIQSISLLPNKVALIRIVTETRRYAQAAPERKPVLITATYTFVDPKSEEDILRNPLGLYIIHFSTTEEIVR